MVESIFSAADQADDELSKILLDSVRNLQRRRITASAVVKHIDLDGGGFLTSYKAVNSLRLLDCSTTERRGRIYGFLPSASSLVRACGAINREARKLVQINEMDEVEGKVFAGVLCTVFSNVVIRLRVGFVTIFTVAVTLLRSLGQGEWN